MDVNLSESITCSGIEMKNYMKSMDEKNIDKFLVLNGKLMFIGNDDYERKIAEDAGIDTSLSNGNFSVEDLKVLAGSVLPLGNEVEVPVGDNGETPEELVGTRLYDKVPQNEDKWDIVIEYNESNEKIKTHGTGYYYIKKGSYTINGKSVTLENDYIIDYKNREFYLLGKNYKEWNIGETLAIKDPMPVLNMDPTNFEKYVNEDGTLNEKNLKNEANIIKYGDVSYSKENKALLFNESPENEEGEGGYLELTKSGDFSNGFTFEMYANMSRLRYDNHGPVKNYYAIGYFSKMKSLYVSYADSMRFGYAADEWICRFSEYPRYTGQGENLYTTGAGVYISDLGYAIGEDFYLTLVYKINVADSLDKVSYYINGKSFGFAYYGSQGYKEGLETWNDDSSPFFIGVCPVNRTGNFYYTKGKIYALRLYNYSMTENEVAESFDTTQKYRNSF